MLIGLVLLLLPAAANHARSDGQPRAREAAAATPPSISTSPGCASGWSAGTSGASAGSGPAGGGRSGSGGPSSGWGWSTWDGSAGSRGDLWLVLHKVPLSRSSLNETARLQRPALRPRPGRRLVERSSRGRRRHRRRRLRLRPQRPRGDDRRAERDRDADRVVPGNNETEDALREACEGWAAATVLHGEGAGTTGVTSSGSAPGSRSRPGTGASTSTRRRPPRRLAGARRARVLVLHSPPHGHCDVSGHGEHLGSRRSSTRSSASGRRSRSAATSTRPGARKRDRRDAGDQPRPDGRMIESRG